MEKIPKEVFEKKSTRTGIPRGASNGGVKGYCEN